ncbi:GNAT family N-acetyltransferase [Marinactinospora rubrisoli]|uniref:GNAT family N-acetyltransferase n=1 Tax=Marinactinospora rubrisoli TaxID=2715399 RepID=A0ABW2KMD1_9ACTN
MKPTPVRADRGHAAAIADLRDACAVWQQRNGIVQWEPGEVPPERIREQIDQGQWWVVQDVGLVAAVRLLSQDPLIWPDPGPVRARYVHGLMAARNAVGQGWGSRLLAWAEDTAALTGHQAVRLDCVATNLRLRGYYERYGYRRRGRVAFGPGAAWHPVMRYEKPLG